MNKTNAVQYLSVLAIGLLIGFFVWGGPGPNTHMMPDGAMMHDQDMAGMMHDMNAKLIGKTGDEFDRIFLEEMIIHHEGAVDMAELALTNAKHQEIKDLARAIIDAQNTEIAQMRSWSAEWYR
jgi:uncharacterized protein (DUF305 family)